MKWAPPYYWFVVKRRDVTCSLNSKYCSLHVVFGSKILVEGFSFHFYSRCLDTLEAAALLAGDCGHWEQSSIASTRNTRPKLQTLENGRMTGVLELMSLEKYKNRVRVDTTIYTKTECLRQGNHYYSPFAVRLLMRMVRTVRCTTKSFGTADPM